MNAKSITEKWNEKQREIPRNCRDVQAWVKQYQELNQFYRNMDVEYSISFSLRTLEKEFDKSSMQHDIERVLMKILFHGWHQKVIPKRGHKRGSIQKSEKISV
jgi:hypothetical protein